MKRVTWYKSPKKISTAEFDAKAERGEDLYDYFDHAKGELHLKVGKKFVCWLIADIDREAMRLKIPKAKVVETWKRAHQLAKPDRFA